MYRFWGICIKTGLPNPLGGVTEIGSGSQVGSGVLHPRTGVSVSDAGTELPTRPSSL